MDTKNTHGSLGSKTFIILREKILNDTYQPGEKLNEVTLSKQLQISRTPIREALKQLELEGLVESIPNRGVFVKGFSARDIDDMFEIRKALESLGIQLAIDRMSDEAFDKITEAFELLEFFTEKKDINRVNELNIQFHDSIYQATQSQYFSKVIKDLVYYITVTSKHSLSTLERLETAMQEHREIYEAIKNKDKELASKKIQEHLCYTQDLVRQHYNDK